MCESDERSTEVIPINQASQVLIHPESGKLVNGGYEFNTEAFRQICTTIGGNLNGVLSTVWRGSGDKPVVKREALLKVYNNLARLRLGELTKYRLVVDTTSREVVGVVSRKYQRVPNLLLLQETWPGVSEKFVAVQAAMENRDLFLLLRRTDSSVKGGDGVWAQGIALYNSETSRRAIYVPRVVYDSGTKSYSLAAESKTNRLVHRKSKGFHQILDSVLQTAIQQPVMTKLIAAASGWRSQPASPGGGAAKTVLKLQRYLLARGFSTAVVDHILQQLRGDDSKGISRRQVYSAVLTTADQSVSSSRSLRILASTFLVPK